MKKIIDELDKRIILELQEDGRKPFSLIGDKIGMSEGTIRNRVKRLIDNDILKIEARVNPYAIPYKVTALVAVNLKKRAHEEVMNRIAAIPCVTSVFNATGRYGLFFEVMVDSLQELNKMLHKKELKNIKEIAETECFVILNAKRKYFRL